MLTKPSKKHIGESVIFQGDAKIILPTLRDASIDFIFTDPPYGHNNNNGDLIHNWEAALGCPTKGKTPLQARPISNDGKEADTLIQWAFKEFSRLLPPGSCCCCCCSGGGGPDPSFARLSLWLDKFLEFKQMVVWDKGPMGMGWHYRRSYETILVAQKPGATCRWFDETNKIENIIRPGDYGIRKIIPSVEQHPTVKPVELAQHFIRLHTQPGDTVLDPFMGSGSTGLACLRLGRRFVGVEIDPVHFDSAYKNLVKEHTDDGLLFSIGSVS